MNIVSSKICLKSKNSTNPSNQRYPFHILSEVRDFFIDQSLRKTNSEYRVLISTDPDVNPSEIPTYYSEHNISYSDNSEDYIKKDIERKLSITSGNNVELALNNCNVYLVSKDDMNSTTKVETDKITFYTNNLYRQTIVLDANSNYSYSTEPMSDLVYNNYLLCISLPFNNNFVIKSNGFHNARISGSGSLYFLYSAEDKEYSLHNQEARFDYKSPYYVTKDSKSPSIAIGHHSAYIIEHSYDNGSSYDKMQVNTRVSNASTIEKDKHKHKVM